MKYASYKPSELKDYRLSAFLGGIDLNEDPVVLPEDKLYECNNVWIKNGLLSTREGIKITDTEINPELKDGYCTCPFTITQTVVTLDAEPYNIAYSMTFDAPDSKQYVCVYLVSKSGEVVSAGNIVSNRISREEFYSVDSVYFLSGAPLKASGIYAFAQKSNSGLDSFCQIYEFSADTQEWLAINESECYAPIIYINGRGTRYDEAVDAYTATPKDFERRNMLTGRFRAFYTSDGCSSSFQLPLSEIDDAPIICKVYRWPGESVEWLIGATESEATAEFHGENVTIRCDRKTGRISFLKEGIDFAIPRMPLYGGNNIVFSAVKSIPNGRERVIGSKRPFSYNSRIYVCGNDVCPNEVYSARITSPLYFPESSIAVVGDTASPVTAIGVQNNKLIAFKNNEIYRIDLTEGKQFSSNEILIGEGTEFYKGDKISISNIHTEIGCDCPDTLRLCGNRLVWVNSEGTVYALATTAYGKENNIYDISLPISNRLRRFRRDELKSAFATRHMGKYLLFVSNMAFIMDYRVKAFGYTSVYLAEDDLNKALAWYCWTFPEEFHSTSAISSTNGIVAACHTGNRQYSYMTCFCGDSDSILLYNDEREIYEQNYPIEFLITTGLIGFGKEQYYKDLKFLCITAGAENRVNLTLVGDGKRITRRLKLPKNPASVKMITHLNGFSRLSLSISGEGAASVGEPIFYYNIRL